MKKFQLQLKIFFKRKLEIYLAFLFTILYGLFFISYNGDIGQFIKTNLTYPILFKSKEKLGVATSLDPKIKIYTFDDIALKKLGREELTLQEWLSLIEAIASRKPKAIFIDKVFSTPIVDMEVSEFNRRIKALGIPIVTDVFASEFPIPYRERKSIDQENFKKAINKGKQDLKSESLEDYSQFEIIETYLYGSHRDLHESFDQNGYVNYYGQGLVQLFRRSSESTFITHWGISGLDNVYFDNGFLFVNDHQIDLDSKAQTLVNFLPLDKIPRFSIYPTYRASQKKTYDRIRVEEGQYVVILPSMYTGNSDFHSTPVGYISGGFIITSVLNSAITGEWLQKLPFEILLSTFVFAMGAIGGYRFKWSQFFAFWLTTIFVIVIGSILLFAYFRIHGGFVLLSIWFSVFSFAAFTVKWFRMDRAARDEKIKREAMYQAAQAVQESLIPDVSLVRRAQIYSFYKAADATGGDWFGAYASSDGRYIYLFIGDVTGHGFSSALLTGTVAGAIKAKVSELDTSPLLPKDALSIIARNVNNVVYQTGAKSKRLMTMAFMCLDLDNRKGYYLNSGHCPVLRFSGDTVHSFVGGGAILGFRGELDISIKEFDFKNHDRFFLYTDGLIENTGPTGDMLKSRAIRKIIKTQKKSSLVISEILNEGNKVWKSNRPEDDCTFFIIEIDLAEIA